MALDIWKEGSLFYLTTHSTHLGTVIWVWTYGRKEMFYLTTHSIHLGTVIWLRTYERKEENVLFNDTLNTFYLWLYG